MIRVVISLEPKDKTWLQHTAEDESVSMAEVIRQAIHHYRLEKQLTSPSSFTKLLSDTKGIWKHGDGLKYQSKMRSDWDKNK